MRDSFVFYKSFREAIKHLPAEEQLAVYNAISDYSLDGINPTLDGAAMAVFILIKPQIDANQKRYANGKKGGRPTAEETNEEPNDNQDITMHEPNVNDNVNVNVNDNVNVNAIVDDFHALCPSMPKIKTLSDKRKKGIHSLAKKGIDFHELFRIAGESKFLTSTEGGNWGGCCFDWLLNYTNALKVLEGNYAKSKEPASTAPKKNNFTDYEQLSEYDIAEFEANAIKKRLGLDSS